MTATDVLFELPRLAQADAALPLAGWFATPVPVDQAAVLRREMQRAAQQALAHGRDAFPPRLGELIAGYWCGRTSEHDYLTLVATAPTARRALVELIYGQLLISCKRLGALTHLDRGFAAAAGELAPPDYFALLKRHELLRLLKLSAAGSAPQTLSDLLTEASVIRVLDKPKPGTHRPPHRPDDTLG